METKTKMYIPLAQQFTASEVRRQAQTFGHGRVNDMLHAFADLLEAQERAVPVGYISVDDIRELDVNREDDAECADAVEMLIASRPFASNHTAIYTHPAPSDAGRWAEALRKKIKEWRGACPNGITEWDRGRRAGLLAADYLAMSVRALVPSTQPPVASVTDEMVMAFSDAYTIHPSNKTGEVPIYAAVEGALEAMLAAQETPND